MIKTAEPRQQAGHAPELALHRDSRPADPLALEALSLSAKEIAASAPRKRGAVSIDSAMAQFRLFFDAPKN